MKHHGAILVLCLLLAASPAFGQIRWIKLTHAPWMKNAPAPAAPAGTVLPVAATAPTPVPTQQAPGQKVIMEQGKGPSAADNAAADAKQKQQPEKYATCAEATEKVPGFSLVKEALQNCPDLLAMQKDPSTAKTFFVPSDKAIKGLATFSHMPVAMLSSPTVKGLMCNVLKYHVVDGVHLKRDWAVGQKMPTMYNSAEITVSAVGQQAQVTTTTGVQANVKRVLFCGNSVVFGLDAVLTPFKIPKLGR